MKKEELKKYVNEYFKRYMCAETLDKFVEHWEETSNAIKYFEKENEHLHLIVKEQTKEIERLNNIINKLRHWIVNNKHNENTKEHYLVVDYGELLNKLQELEGSDKE